VPLGSESPQTREETSTESRSNDHTKPTHLPPPLAETKPPPRLNEDAAPDIVFEEAEVASTFEEEAPSRVLRDVDDLLEGLGEGNVTIAADLMEQAGPPPPDASAPTSPSKPDELGDKDMVDEKDILNEEDVDEEGWEQARADAKQDFKPGSIPPPRPSSPSLSEGSRSDPPGGSDPYLTVLTKVYQLPRERLENMQSETLRIMATFITKGELPKSETTALTVLQLLLEVLGKEPARYRTLKDAKAGVLFYFRKKSESSKSTDSMQAIKVPIRPAPGDAQHPPPLPTGSAPRLSSQSTSSMPAIRPPSPSSPDGEKK
jgi:hypothetical protein